MKERWSLLFWAFYFRKSSGKVWHGRSSFQMAILLKGTDWTEQIRIVSTSALISHPQINNKACGTVTVPQQVSKDCERVQQLIMESPFGQKLLGGRRIKRAVLSPRTPLINLLIDEWYLGIYINCHKYNVQNDVLFILCLFLIKDLGFIGICCLFPIILPSSQIFLMTPNEREDLSPLAPHSASHPGPALHTSPSPTRLTSQRRRTVVLCLIHGYSLWTLSPPLGALSQHWHRHETDWSASMCPPTSRSFNGLVSKRRLCYEALAVPTLPVSYFLWCQHVNKEEGMWSHWNVRYLCQFCKVSFRWRKCGYFYSPQLVTDEKHAVTLCKVIDCFS